MNCFERQKEIGEATWQGGREVGERKGVCLFL